MNFVLRLAVVLFVCGKTALATEDQACPDVVVDDRSASTHEIVAWANNGNVDAQVALGTVYANGICGTDADMGKALYWWKTAANQGSVKAQMALGYRYGTGFGVGQNFTEAYHWLKMIDDQGDPSGAEQIGEFYEHGTGVL
jgi:TPR repeat protein